LISSLRSTSLFGELVSISHILEPLVVKEFQGGRPCVGIDCQTLLNEGGDRGDVLFVQDFVWAETVFN
jgi:hypothetical protein